MMRNIIKFKISFLLVLSFVLLTQNCGDEQFSTLSQTGGAQHDIEKNNSYYCAKYTLVKPKVDFLFLWDNSSSSTFINPETKRALIKTIELVSENFDYHIFLAPLIGSGNSKASLITSTQDGLSQSAKNIHINKNESSSALDKISSAIASGSKEQGLRRTVNLISNNITNGIFRRDSYIVIVLMSNEDDNSFYEGLYPTSQDREEYTSNMLNKLTCHLESSNNQCSNKLESLQIRFVSLVAHSTGSACSKSDASTRAGVYIEFSKRVYNKQSLDISASNSTDYPDSFDICSRDDFTNIFDEVYNTIKLTLLKHKYNYWPIGVPDNFPVDENKIIVKKDGVNIQKITEDQGNNGISGYSYEDVVLQNQNTRYEPSSGEPITGKLIKLHNDARVIYPQCLSVYVETRKRTFGYIRIAKRPALPTENYPETISIWKNKEKLEESNINGWKLLLDDNGNPSEFNNKNLTILNPVHKCNDSNRPSSCNCQGLKTTDYCPNNDTHAIRQNGYFVQLFGTAIYEDGDLIELRYIPSRK